MVYFQSRQRKFAGLIEIFKLLNGKEQREARAMLFEAYRKYKETGNDSIFDDEFHKEYVNRTISDFNEVGALVKKGLVSTNLFLDVYWNITLRSWNASRIIIQKRRASRNYDEYMINFEVLARDAEKYKNRRFPNASVDRSDSSYEGLSIWYTQNPSSINKGISVGRCPKIVSPCETQL